MSEPAATEREPSEERPYVCEDCGEGFKAPGHLANHRKHKHGIEPPPKPQAPQRPAARLGSLELRIKDACLGSAAVAGIADPRLYIAVEGTVDQFAKAWANVARQSPTAAKYIDMMLTGGVWIPAIMSTVVMAVAVLMATDRLPTNLAGLGYYALGQMTDESKQKLVAMHTAQASANGGDPLGTEAA